MAYVSDEERKLFLEAVQGSTFVTPLKDGQRRSASAKKRKKSAVDAKIDLHGMTREAANFTLRAFIERCVALRKTRLLIIHGKGSGALRDEVRQILANHRDVVLISDAPTKLGGDGAVVVNLNPTSPADAKALAGRPPSPLSR